MISSILANSEFIRAINVARVMNEDTSKTIDTVVIGEDEQDRILTEASNKCLDQIEELILDGYYESNGFVFSQYYVCN